MVRVDDEGLLAQEQHLEHGGLLVPVEGEPPAPMVDVVVVVEAPAGRAELAARVVSVLPGVGVGLALEDTDAARQQLGPLLDHARRGASEGTNLQLRISRMSMLEKQELAMTG